MVAGERRRRASPLAWCRGWSLWRLPRAVLAYVLGVEVVAVVAVAAVAGSTPVTGRHWVWFAVLAGAAVVHFEAARGRFIAADSFASLAAPFDPDGAIRTRAFLTALPFAPAGPTQIARMRAELDRSDAAAFDLKQGEGGLVDLEFAVQTLQLRHGAALHPQLERAVRALAEAGLIPCEIVSAHNLLTRMLVMFRLVSPSSDAPPEATRPLVAQACGMADWESLLAAHDDAHALAGHLGDGIAPPAPGTVARHRERVRIGYRGAVERDDGLRAGRRGHANGGGEHARARQHRDERAGSVAAVDDDVQIQRERGVRQSRIAGVEPPPRSFVEIDASDLVAEGIDGQIDGGVAHGLGNALTEEVKFNEEGQPLTTSFMDYRLITAVDMPPLVKIHTETPSPESVSWCSRESAELDR